MKITNLILAVFFTATVTQAQNPLMMNADSILASTSSLSFSTVRYSAESDEKEKTILPEKMDDVDIETLSEVKKTPPDFVFFCYPSMFTDALYVTTDLAESTEIQLVNESGSIVFKHKTDGIIENEKFTIPTVLPAGTYFLKVKDQEAASIKLVKRN